MNYRDMSNIWKMFETTLEILNKNWKAASVFNIVEKKLWSFHLSASYRKQFLEMMFLIYNKILELSNGIDMWSF